LGQGSHILKALVRDSNSLEKLLAQIQSWHGVTRTVTSFILSTIKETTILDIYYHLTQRERKYGKE